MAARGGRFPAPSGIEEADRGAGSAPRGTAGGEGLGVIRRTLLAFTLAACAHPAAGQGTIEFFPRYDFHLGAEHLSQADPRFVWDTNFGGDMDLVDYRAGRTTFAANYEAVLGNEFRHFDPNQGNYFLDLSSSARAHGYEFAALLHHTSRHLGDRFKRVPVDWNMFGVA